jgi:3'(2'), 5'-bisphosphate nucleotidase
VTVHTFEHLAERLLPAVLRAGAVIMQHRSEGLAVESKPDASPVTAADRDAEEIIVDALARIAPGVPIIAEETVSGGQPALAGPEFFLVDPLDGTREFVRGGGDFTVNIGLVRERRPRFGLIYAPASAQLFVTLGDRRAAECRVEPGSGVERLAALSLKEIATREPDLKRITAVASRSHLSAETRRFLQRHAISDYVTIGSSLKFCLIARGEADIYPRFGPTCEWDTAAGHAILLAAGGEVTTADGGPFEYGKAEAQFLNPSFIAWGRRSLIRSFLG